MKTILTLLVAGFVASLYVGGPTRLVILVVADLVHRFSSTTGTGRITRCCTQQSLARGHYASTTLPRTTFEVTYNGGAGAKLVSASETIYLMRDCRAVSAKRGTGRWAWANGGTSIEFEGPDRIGFPRQVLEGLPEPLLRECASG